MKKRKAIFIFMGLLLAVGLVYANPALAQDAQTIERLERMIKEQQQQLESLQQQLNQLKQTATEAQSQAKEAKSAAEEAKASAQAPVEKMVTSGQERVKLAISGQVDRAVNIIDDGKNTDAYYVDNDSSNSRVRFIGTAKATDDLTLGSKIELAFAPNESSQVSQDTEDSGDFTDERYVEMSLDSKRFGKLTLGKGDTASNYSAEVDLSKTDIIAYASIADIAGGMLFRQSNGDSLTNVKVSDAFKDLDGLSRKSRVRYDTPTLYGFSLAGSTISDQRWDAALRWGGQGYYQYDGSFSLLHEATGLNLTLSAGLLDRDGQNSGTNLWGKLGWLTKFFSVGETAFSVDYDRSINFPTNRDKGYSVGGAAVQQFENYGSELYLQYRVYSLDRDVEPSVQDMYVGTIGARVKF
jgi:uncharacterized coiled-coil protein SlyX